MQNNYGRYKKRLLGFFIYPVILQFHIKDCGENLEGSGPSSGQNTAHGLGYIKFVPLWHNCAIFKFTANDGTINWDNSISAGVQFHTRYNPIIGFHRHESTGNAMNREETFTWYFHFFLSPSDKTQSLATSFLILMRTWCEPVILKPSFSLCSSSSSIKPSKPLSGERGDLISHPGTLLLKRHRGTQEVDLNPSQTRPCEQYQGQSGSLLLAIGDLQL